VLKIENYRRLGGGGHLYDRWTEDREALCMPGSPPTRRTLVPSSTRRRDRGPGGNGGLRLRRYQELVCPGAVYVTGAAEVSRLG